MRAGSIIAIYLLFWFLTLFAVLPFRIQTTREAGGDPVPGQAESAPHNLRLVWRLKWTTIVATTLFALFYLNYVRGWVNLDDLRISLPR